MQDQLNYFYTTIIPSDFAIMEINGLTCLYSIRYIGSILGSLSTVFGLLFSYDKKNLGIFFTIQNSFAIIIQIIILIFFFINSNNFADRPIRRIIYSKNIREIRRTEL